MIFKLRIEDDIIADKSIHESLIQFSLFLIDGLIDGSKINFTHHVFFKNHWNAIILIDIDINNRNLET